VSEGLRYEPLLPGDGNPSLTVGALMDSLDWPALGQISHFHVAHPMLAMRGAIATQVCYAKSMPSVTSSFRMSKELQRVLSDAAERTGKGKNAIIIEALVKYLKAMERESLAEEARRQSELVSRNEQDADWYGMADTSGWR
jgi:predicted DNA-binding protein